MKILIREKTGDPGAVVTEGIDVEDALEMMTTMERMRDMEEDVAEIETGGTETTAMITGEAAGVGEEEAVETEIVVEVVARMGATMTTTTEVETGVPVMKEVTPRLPRMRTGEEEGPSQVRRPEIDDLLK